MAICAVCAREMLDAKTCTERFVELVDGRYERIRYGQEDLRLDGETCNDCGVALGGLHHPGCDVERCPRCGDQQISCDCFETWDDDD
jgi:hypothetical protein